jgi:hypothetical protein
LLRPAGTLPCSVPHLSEQPDDDNNENAERPEGHRGDSNERNGHPAKLRAEAADNSHHARDCPIPVATETPDRQLWRAGR